MTALYTGWIRWLTNDEQLLSAGHASLDSETETVELPAQLLWAAADEGARSEPPACELVPEPEEWQGPVTLACRGEREKVMLALRRFRYLEDQDELAVLSGGLCSDQLGNVLQVMCLSADELALYGVQGCAVNIGETVPISRQHETRVGMALAAACRHALARCVCVCVCVRACVQHVRSTAEKSGWTREDFGRDRRKGTRQCCKAGSAAAACHHRMPCMSRGLC